MTTSEIETATVSETADPARFVVTARQGVLARLVDALLAGAPFVTLTGPSGAGKTTMAAAVQELLAARSVAATRIAKSNCGAIRLRTMAAQLLGKSEDAIDSDDVERLFDVMTVHRSSAQRHVIIVDDAELLHAEVLAYLRLLRSIGIEQVPQFLFVGGPSFWTRIGDAVADVRDLITVRVDLEPLTAADSRRFAELLLASSGRAAGTAFDKAAFERLVSASDGLTGRLVSLLAGVAGTSVEVARQHVADRPVASGETDDVSRSENDADPVPDDAVPLRDRFDPEVATALFGAPSVAGRAISRSYRAPVLAGVVGAVMLAGMVGAVAYREIWVPADPDTQAEPATTIEASDDSVQAASPAGVSVARSEPAFGIMQSAQAAASGSPEADMAPSAFATATPEAVTPPAQRNATATAAPLTASSPITDLPGLARSSVLPVVLSNDAAVPMATDENPPANAASPSSTQPVSTSPQAATVLLPRADAAATGDPPVPAAAEPAAPPPVTQTETPVFVAQSPVTPSADTDTVNADATSADLSVSTQPAALSPSGENTVPSPAQSLPAAPSAEADTVNTDATSADRSPGAQPAAPPSSGENTMALPAPSPPATPSKAAASDTAGFDTGSSATGAQPSASLPAPAEPAPPVTMTPDAAPAVPAFDAAAAEAPAIPAATQPAAAPPAVHSQTAANVVPTGGTASNAPSATSASSRFPPPDVGSLLSRGEAMLALGDISAARLLYERAAAIGSARAATALGKTYDPAFLTSIQVSGLAPNRAAAVLWYRKGAEMGDAEAADRLARLTAAQ